MLIVSQENVILVEDIGLLTLWLDLQIVVVYYVIHSHFCYFHFTCG